ncbi:helix-turn-helix transcriptional regulator [Burkholderia cenocepacia]|uniref:helix-turn-helix domain-containing protein n=1 Tax=Burkholderia cenocepacia TaxID=95486 RepID=UPI002656DDA4|nr:helix-turn-helix transcriptional regulator [Burkholderia cenocepacia]MDN7825118.1 helix-turn-helix transcriptional regulator [Burkholderia cenocepacia]
MNNLNAVRKRLGLSQKQLAAVCGVGQSAVSQYENGTCDPAIGVARKVIDYARENGVSVTLDEVYSTPAHGTGREFPDALAALQGGQS